SCDFSMTEICALYKLQVPFIIRGRRFHLIGGCRNCSRTARCATSAATRGQRPAAQERDNPDDKQPSRVHRNPTSYRALRGENAEAHSRTEGEMPTRTIHKIGRASCRGRGAGRRATRG